MAHSTGNDPALFLIDNQAPILQAPSALFLFADFLFHPFNLIKIFVVPEGLMATLMRFTEATTTLLILVDFHKKSPYGVVGENRTHWA